MNTSSICSSEGIESVVGDEEGKSAGLINALCPVCKMAAVWMKSQLGLNKTRDVVLKYANEVEFFHLTKIWYNV